MKEQQTKDNECISCGERENLRYCEYCKYYLCDGKEDCFGWTSSHESGCHVIFNLNHPNLDEEMAFYERQRIFERSPVIP